MAAVLGGELAYANTMPSGLVPALLLQSEEPFRIAGKHPGIIVLSDKPLCAETPAHLLDDAVTPADKLFVRNNGIPPLDTDRSGWSVRIEGESIRSPTTFSLAELEHDFESRTYQLQLECAGNGRSEFYPPASGNQWTTGAIGCPTWTGVRLRDVLDRCDVRDGAIYIGYYGADRHLSDPGKVPISRGVPMTKALEDPTLLAWAMNGKDLPSLHGGPLRLVCGGFPGSVSGKWLRRIVVRDRIHDGAKMTGMSYRVPRSPVAPGTQVDATEMRVIESMPVKSLVTYPRSGIVLDGRALPVRGHAWAGDLAVTEVHVSIDFGQTWHACDLADPVNRLAWQRWTVRLSFPKSGYYEIWARATDERGRTQPMVVPGWNPRGYLNNACHRVAVRVRT